MLDTKDVKEEEKEVRFRTKEECFFYSNSINKFICDPNHNLSDSSFSMIISHFGKEYELFIQNYKFGIINISFDLKDKNLKYKNSVNIGDLLEKKPFKNIEILKNKIILTTTDDKEKNIKENIEENIYKIIVYTDNFKLEYFMNDKLLLDLNSKESLNLLFEINSNPKKNLKSNTFDFSLKNINKCFGIPERSSSFFLKDDTYRLFNCDHPEQVPYESQCTYGSIPVLYGINKEYIVSVFNHNYTDQFVEIKTQEKNKDIKWISEGGIINLYLFSDTDYYRNFRKFAFISGFSPLPPLWALGYHHCRYGFKSKYDVTDVITKFDENKIPFDCFWFDIDHTDGKRYFTWDEKNFGNMETFFKQLEDKNRYFVTIIDPHIKVDDNYKICKKLKENDCLVKIKNENGELVNFMGYCWPGNSYYTDFYNFEKLLKIYSEFYRDEEYFLNFNNFGTWIDMNEPSVFSTKEDDYTMPSNAIHFDGKKFVEHSEVHNIYGLSYHKVMYNALKARFEYKNIDIRPFILTRSFYAGTQKYGWIWTGDQQSTFDFMNLSMETNLVIGLCGISGSGTDTGGFLEDPTEELTKAWFSLGIFYIFFRGHSDSKTIRREPWLFSDETKNFVIENIKLRYHLLLFFYTKFYEYTKNAVPILKPLFMLKQFRNEFDNLTEDNKQGSVFVLGNELIGINNYYLTQKTVDILNTFKTPLLYKLNGEVKNGKFKIDKNEFTEKIVIGGNIIPWTDNVELCSYYVLRNPLTIKFYLDENMKAKGNLYIDDGISEKSCYLYLEFSFENGKIKCSVLNSLNSYVLSYLKNIISKFEKFEIFGFKEVKNAKIFLKENNEAIDVKVEYSKEVNLITIDFNETKKEIKIIDLNEIILE